MNNTNRNSSEQLKINWFRILVPFIAVVVLGLIIASIKYFGTERADTRAVSSIELNWKGASSGKAPNGERYDILRLDNSTIIAEAITKLGLDTTVEEVQANLVILGNYPKNIVEELTGMKNITEIEDTEEVKKTDFHPSTYTIYLNDNFDKKLSKKQLTALLTEINNGYYADFFKEYTINFETTTTDAVLDTSRYDYDQILSVISYRLALVERNANSYSGLNNLFRYNNQSFSDLATVASKIVSTELNMAKAECMMRGLSKDYKTRLQSYYYTIRSLQFELAEEEKNLESVNALIDSFERDQSAFVSTGVGVEYQQGNSNATYQSLISRKTACSESISSLTSEINYYEELIANLNNSVNATEYATYCTALDNQIVSLMKKTTDLEKTLADMVEYYNDTEIDDDALAFSEVKVTSPSILSVGFIAAIIKACGPLCMLVIIYALALELRRRILMDRQASAEEE